MKIRGIEMPERCCSCSVPLPGNVMEKLRARIQDDPDIEDCVGISIQCPDCRGKPIHPPAGTTHTDKNTIWG